MPGSSDYHDNFLELIHDRVPSMLSIIMYGVLSRLMDAVMLCSSTWTLKNMSALIIRYGPCYRSASIFLSLGTWIWKFVCYRVHFRWPRIIFENVENLDYTIRYWTVSWPERGDPKWCAESKDPSIYDLMTVMTYWPWSRATSGHREERFTMIRHQRNSMVHSYIRVIVEGLRSRKIRFVEVNSQRSVEFWMCK